jgi:hypothetical protein
LTNAHAMKNSKIRLQHSRARWIHRLLFWRYGIAADFVLNTLPAPQISAHPQDLAGELLRRMQAIKAEAFDLGAGRVDYRVLVDSPTYLDYRRCAGLLRFFDPADLQDPAERVVFWINLYNALIIDGVIQFGVGHSVNEIPGFFWRAAYQIGDYRFSANDIEYGILRANAAHPAIPGPHFGRQDPRRQFSLDTLDPRIHFTLVCAARSCPPIAVYSPGRIDEQLDLATRAFINNGGVEVDPQAGILNLSKIFQWYAPDFGARPFALGSKKPLFDFIARYLSQDSARDFVLYGNPDTHFQPYDWRLNLPV